MKIWKSFSRIKPCLPPLSTVLCSGQKSDILNGINGLIPQADTTDITPEVDGAVFANLLKENKTFQSYDVNTILSHTRRYEEKSRAYAQT